MPGLQLGTGLSGSVFSNGYPGYQSAAVPGASTVPEGPVTITQQAFGVPSPSSGGRKGLHAAGIGTIALGLLFFIWWTLPR
jgi:hypothetical protein